MTVPFTTSVTLIARAKTGVDSDGNDVYGETETVVQGVVGPGPSSEITSAQDLVTTQPTAYLPAGVAVAAIDALEAGGLRYEVDGDPQNWPQHPFTGWRPPLPIVVPLRRVTG